MGYGVNDFYNAERKLKFLEHKGLSISRKSLKSYERLFAIIKQDEERYGSDFCDFNYDTLINVLSLRLSRGRNSKGTQISQLREYVNWCISQHLKISNDNPIASIKSSDIDSSVQIRKQFIKNPEHLEEILDEVLETEKDANMIDVMNRMSCWLIYLGFTDKEVINLEKDDVDFDNNTITSHDGTKTIEMTPTLRRLVEQAIDAEYTVRGGNKRALQYKLEDTNKLYRKVKMKHTNNTVEILRSKFSYIKDDYEKTTYEAVSLAASRLWLSGMFYRLYQKEQNGEVLTDDDFNYNISEGMNANAKRVKQKRNRQEYEDWKKAYEL